jgi:hypothetical protein
VPPPRDAPQYLEAHRLMEAGSGRSWYVSVLCLIAAVCLVAVLAEHTRASTASFEISER